MKLVKLFYVGEGEIGVDFSPKLCEKTPLNSIKDIYNKNRFISLNGSE